MITDAERRGRKEREGMMGRGDGDGDGMGDGKTGTGDGVTR
jgi:hypothetical protein